MPLLGLVLSVLMYCSSGFGVQVVLGSTTVLLREALGGPGVALCIGESSHAIKPVKPV